MKGLARLIGTEQDEVELDIRRGQLRARLGENSALAGADGQGPGALDQPLQAHALLLKGALDPVVQRNRLGATINGTGLEVILKIGAHAWQVMHHLDLMLLEMVAWTDAGELEDLRRSDGACRRMTSPATSARFSSPFCQYITPVARLPSTTTLVTKASVMTARLGRYLIGWR